MTSDLLCLIDLDAPAAAGRPLLALLVCLLTVLLEFLLYRLELWTVRAHPTDSRTLPSVGRAAPPEWRFSKALA